MSKSAISRRAFVATAVCVAVAPAVAATSAARFREIRIDTSGVRERGDTVTADAFSRILPGLVSRALGANFAPGDRSAAALVVRVTLAVYGPIHEGTHFGPRATDFVEGVALVTQGGRTLASYPLTISNDVTPSRNDITEESTRYRVEGLAAALGHWLPSQIGM